MSRTSRQATLSGSPTPHFLRIPLGALQHPIQAAGAHPGQTLDSQVSTIAKSTDAERVAPAVPPPSPTLIKRFERSPAFCLSTRLGPTPAALTGDGVRLT